MSGNRWLIISRASFTASWALATLNLRQAPSLFAWPLLYTLTVGDRTYPVGGVLLLPLIAAVATAVWLRTSSHGWDWGRPSVTVPVVALGALALVRSWPVHRVEILVASVVGVLLFWGVYAYTLQVWRTDWATWVLCTLMVVYGGIGLVQFAWQRSIGLSGFGELILDPQVRGVSVVEVAGQRWLRAYGLLPHPNVFGGMMGLGVLVCVGALLCDPRRSRWFLAPIGVGAAALFLSFSRSAWLGTLAGLAYIGGTTRLWRSATWRGGRARGLLTVGGIVVVVTGLAFSGLLVARLGQSSSALEQSSVNERVRDMGQAWMLIRHLPLRGVGTGYYVDALWAWAQATGRIIPGFQSVHNVPLLLSAEMGGLGGLLWLWLVGVVPLAMAWAARDRPESPARARWGAALLFLFVVGMLDAYPNFLSFRSGTLLGMVCGFCARREDANAVRTDGA